MAIEWITVRHSKTGHEHRIPNRRHLLEDWAKRGWKPASDNQAKTPVSTKES